MRHVLDRADIRRHILAFRAVAARGRHDKLALFVAQRTGKPVDLRLGGDNEFVLVGKLQKAPDAVDEVPNVFFREGIAERKHRHRVPHFSELAGRRRTHLAREARQRMEFGELPLDRLIALAQGVVFGVGDRRRVLLVVAPVVLLDLELQPHMLGLGFLDGEFFDGLEPVRFCFFSHRRATQPRRRSGGRQLCALRR